MGGKWIVNAREHKVQEGETIKTLAEKAGIKWEDLALFNWGTDNPEEINKHLRNDVGCYKLTEDRKNFKFTGKEDPGIVYIPEEFPGQDLSLDSTTTITVKPVIKKTFVASNVMVEFRPKSDWKGEFGFDWLRIGDVKMEVVGKERYKTIIEGGYNIVDANGDGSTADEAFYQLKTKEYNSIPTKVKNKAYRVPWLNLYPPSAKGTPPPPVSAELQILVTVEGEKPPQNIEFDFNKSLFSLTKLSISDKAIGPKRIASDGTVKITCLEEYDTNQEIRVLVDPAASLMLNQPISLAGKIIICANSKRMRLKLILIRVKTDISGTPLTGNYTPVEKINLSNTLYQAFIYGYLESGPILDLSGDVNFRRATNGKFLDPVKDEINQNHVDIFNYVRQEFFKIDANKKYEKNYFLSFSFNEPATGGIIGQAEDIGVRCVFLFADRDPYTLNHEVLHGLFLNHTHEDTGYPVTENYKYIFTYGKTDNVMSYNSVSKTLMRWQWKILRKKFK